MCNATSECVDIYAESALVNGLCIGPLTNDKRLDAVKRVRDHIGRGIRILCEDNEVWIYNQSDYSICGQSPTLDYMSKGQLPAVKKVQPVYSTRVFDFERCREMLNARRHHGVETCLTIRSHSELASRKAGDLATRDNIQAVAYAGLKYFSMSHGSSTCIANTTKDLSTTPPSGF